MEHKVIKKQTNSRNCFICGLDNESGVKAPFYNLDDNTVATIFQFKDTHQSYPSRTHGGIISAMLDELVGRALWIDEPDTYAVTTSMTIKFRKPVLYNTQLKGRGYIVKNSARMYVGRGEIYDMSNNILAEMEANYLKLDPSIACNGTMDIHEEMCYDIPDDISSFDFPEKKEN